MSRGDKVFPTEALDKERTMIYTICPEGGKVFALLTYGDDEVSSFKLQCFSAINTSQIMAKWTIIGPDGKPKRTSDFDEVRAYQKRLKEQGQGQSPATPPPEIAVGAAMLESRILPFPQQTAS